MTQIDRPMTEEMSEKAQNELAVLMVAATGTSTAMPWDAYTKALWMDARGSLGGTWDEGMTVHEWVAAAAKASAFTKKINVAAVVVNFLESAV